MMVILTDSHCLVTVSSANITILSRQVKTKVQLSAEKMLHKAVNAANLYFMCQPFTIK